MAEPHPAGDRPQQGVEPVGLGGPRLLIAGPGPGHDRRGVHLFRRAHRAPQEMFARGDTHLVDPFFSCRCGLSMGYRGTCRPAAGSPAVPEAPDGPVIHRLATRPTVGMMSMRSNRAGAVVVAAVLAT